MIDVIIPAYNAHKFITNLLFSITTQTIKDSLNIYIINDCSEKDYKEEINKFKDFLKITEIKSDKNRGPGHARQLGIENSNSKYIIFIDADDILYDCISIETLYNKIDKENLNVVSSNFIEETIFNSICTHGPNAIWVHGKIFRRDFINRYKLKFNDTRANEDTGFNKLASICTNYSYIDNLTYIWRCNNTSITRGSDYSFYGLDGFCYNICWAIKEAKKRKLSESAIGEAALEALVDLYYRYIYYKDREDKDLILKWTKELKSYYLEYKDKIDEGLKHEGIYSIIDHHYHTYLGPDGFLENDLAFSTFVDLIK